jgi:hypothetical protein
VLSAGTSSLVGASHECGSVRHIETIKQKNMYVRSDAHDGAVGLAARAEKEEPGAFKEM